MNKQKTVSGNWHKIWSQKIKEQNVNVTHMSIDLGISHRTLRNYLSGKTGPSFDNHDSICKYLGITLNYHGL